MTRWFATIGLLTASLALVVAVAAPAGAASRTRSEATMLINELGAVEVVDRWSNLVQESGTFDYFSATKEVGIVPVAVKDHGFTINFSTRSYLRFEDGTYYFCTPDYYYSAGPLDVELTLTYPPNLRLVSSRPAPAYQGDGVLHWSIPGAAHDVVVAQFERIGPFTPAENSDGDGVWEVDPAVLSRLSAEELPLSADEVLKEFETIIAVARASGATDPDFLRVMDKLLAKFYYIFSIYGLLDGTELGSGDPLLDDEGLNSAEEAEKRHRNEKVHGYW